MIIPKEEHINAGGSEGSKTGNLTMEDVTSGQTEVNESCHGRISGGSLRSGRSSSSTGRRFRVPPFLNKVYELVNDPETNVIISWTSGGTRFTVWDHHKFTKEILPKYFRHDVFSSFVYQLNNYGFKKTSWDYWEYENKWFQQGKEHLLVNIRRKNEISAARRNRGAKHLLDSDNLTVEKLLKKQETMEKQIESLFKQQKIVISMVSAFVPKYAQQYQQCQQNVKREEETEEVEIVRKSMVASENIKNGNALELSKVPDHSSSHQTLVTFDNSSSLVENHEQNVDSGTNLPSSNAENSCLVAVDENNEQTELADQQSSMLMELEDLMTPAELHRYFNEFMPQVQFQETKPSISPEGEEDKVV